MSWTVQERLLITHSTFFQACLLSTFHEAASNVVDLPDDEAEIFEMFIQYLYTGTAAFSDHTPIQVAKAWVLGDKLDSPIFTFQVLRQLVLMHRKDHLNCTPELIKYIFENCAITSDISTFATYQFVVECWAGEHAEALREWVQVAQDVIAFNIQIAIGTVLGKSKELCSLYMKPRVNEQSYFEAWVATIPMPLEAVAKVEDDEHESEAVSFEPRRGKRMHSGKVKYCRDR